MLISAGVYRQIPPFLTPELSLLAGLATISGARKRAARLSFLAGPNVGTGWISGWAVCWGWLDLWLDRMLLRMLEPPPLCIELKNLV